MEKTSVAAKTAVKEITSRHSLRAYSEQPVEQEKINSLLEAARWAPSSMNEQPWRYILATKQDHPDLYQKIFDTLVEANQIWVKRAPVLLVSLARKTFLRNGAANRHAMYDVGAANSLLCVETSALGLNAHQLGGFHYESLKNVLHVPDDIEIACVIAIGYPGKTEDLPENLQIREKAPRERYTLVELVSSKIIE